MKQLKIMFVIMIITGLMCTATYAQPGNEKGGEEKQGCYGEEGPNGRGKYDREGKMDKMMEELGLTDEQKEQMKAQREEQKGNREKIWKELRAKREQMSEEINKETTDRSKIDTLIKEISGLHQQQMQQRVDSILGMKEILTPEQFKELNERHQQMKKKHKNKHKGFKQHEKE